MFSLITLFALSTGVITDPMGLSFGSVRVLVRHKGTPLPFTLHVRTKESRSGEWEYVENLSYFPRRLMSSPIGREIRLRLPSGLKTYSQVCARMGPPESNPSSGFRVDLSIQSCANLPSVNKGDSIGWVPSNIREALGLNSQPQVVIPVGMSKVLDQV